MHILHILHSILTFFATPYFKMSRASALTWVVLITNADLAIKNLQDVNMAHAVYIQYLEERVRKGQQKQMKMRNYAWSCAILLLERIAVIEAQARDTQIDLAEKEEELETVRQAYNHAQARIVSLENALSKNASEHKDHIRALAMSNLAMLKINRAQGDELKNLQSQVGDHAIARQEEQQAEAQRINMKTAKIEAMTKQRKMSRRVQETRQHAHRQIIMAHADKIADLEKTVTAKDKMVKKLRSKVASLERIATGAIAERKERENEVLSLQAEVGQMKEQVAEGAVTMVVRQLAMTEQLGAMEKRAEEAEEQVTSLMREREENAAKVHHTICRLASVHAKQMADLEARKMNVDAPAPATVIGKRTSESLDFSVRHVGRQRRSGVQGRQEENARPQKRVRW
ncbi:hypothetical protein FB45DRAFT_859408 [Roridomyces roridus]|uniref:Uncharacterized protein n=1 Tax=Roridomyces roridus TaxID=1738132 RepID=A0AAD7CJW4_9AGAR|nr:hypothetical protein FB45DRAFT_859408 [Roridomyces roridus]